MNESNQKKSAFTLGETIFGPLIFAFCSFIHSVAMEHKLEQLIFFSRDMKLVMEAYQFLYENCIPSCYFHVSRKSLEAVESSPVQKQAFLTYMKNSGFSESCGFVDIGWQGQIQYKLNALIKESMLNEKMPLGIYFGKFNTLDFLCGKNNVVSFLNSGKVLPAKFQTLNRSIEAFFSANEDKTIGYKSDSTPIFEIDSRCTDGINAFQQGALSYIRKAKVSEKLCVSKKQTCRSVSAFLDFLIHPTLEELTFFQNDYFEDDKIIKLFEVKQNFKQFMSNITNITWKGAYFRVNNKPFFLCWLYMWIGGFRLRFINTQRIEKIKNGCK